MDGVTAALLRMYLLLLAVVLVGGFLVSRWLLGPFKVVLTAMKSFSVRSEEPLHLAKTSTVEFGRLNAFLNLMASRSRREYGALKEFSEHASHEIQTPLAIARGKLELLMQSSKMGGEELRLVQSALQSINRLSRLGRSLGLLTKIENEEFANAVPVNVQELLQGMQEDFEELISVKGLTLTLNLQEEVTWHMDPALADVLVINLMQNAIRHNTEQGTITITLEKGMLTISNTGNAPEQPTEQLFQRFKKGRGSEASIGLGLSIVKRICDLNSMSVTYVYANERHTVKVVQNQQA